MTTYRKLSVGVALCLFVTLTAPARADNKEPPKPTVESLKKDLDDLKTQLNLAVEKQKEDAKSLKNRFDDMEKSLGRLVTNMDALYKEQVRMSNYLAPEKAGGADTADTTGLTLEERVRLLEEKQREQARRLRDQEREINDLKARLGGGTTSDTRDTGSFLLDNSRMSRGAIFVINGTSYRVPAFQTRTITGHQAGAFTYEVFVDGYTAGTGTFSRTLRRDQVYRIFTQP